MTCCLWHSGRAIVTFWVYYDISGELVWHTGLIVTYWVTGTYCGPTEVNNENLAISSYHRQASSPFLDIFHRLETIQHKHTLPVVAQTLHTTFDRLWTTRNVGRDLNSWICHYLLSVLLFVLFHIYCILFVNKCFCCIELIYFTRCAKNTTSCKKIQSAPNLAKNLLSNRDLFDGKGL